MRLADLGERRIVREILPRFVTDSGDDCAAMGALSGTVLATTDPVPTPAARVIGGDDDLFWVGWLLVTINASDLAAGGAMPLGFLAAIDAPADLDVCKFERLLEGISCACTEEGLNYVGGNLREASAFLGVGTALGICDGYRPATRRGATPGDILVSVGPGGVFWRDALAMLRGGGAVDKTSSPVFSPRSQLRYMSQLVRRGLVRCAIDNSDGMLPSLNQLAEANRVRIELDLEALSVPNVDANPPLDAGRLWLGWGDWNVFITVRAGDARAVSELVETAGGSATVIGEVLPGDSGVYLKRNGTVIPAPPLESERFSSTSWFRTGISAYVEAMLAAQLPE